MTNTGLLYPPRALAVSAQPGFSPWAQMGPWANQCLRTQSGKPANPEPSLSWRALGALCKFLKALLKVKLWGLHVHPCEIERVRWPSVAFNSTSSYAHEKEGEIDLVVLVTVLFPEVLKSKLQELKNICIKISSIYKYSHANEVSLCGLLIIV